MNEQGKTFDQIPIRQKKENVNRFEKTRRRVIYLGNSSICWHLLTYMKRRRQIRISFLVGRWDSKVFSLFVPVVHYNRNYEIEERRRLLIVWYSCLFCCFRFWFWVFFFLLWLVCISNWALSFFLGFFLCFFRVLLWKNSEYKSEIVDCT
jgi:hypothetical protein